MSLTVALAPACSDDQAAWCDDLEEIWELVELRTAAMEGDAAAAQGELERFSEVASEAPEEIRDDMQQISALLEEVVAIGMAGGTTSDDELERRRERANQQLASMPERTARVAAWAERECGLRLDD